MSRLSTTPISLLDLAPLRDDDKRPGPALRSSLALAQHAERLGFSRYWVAEHHNMEGIASSATAVLLGLIVPTLQREHATRPLLWPWTRCAHSSGTHAGAWGPSMCVAMQSAG